MTARSITLLVSCLTLSALSLRAASRDQDGEQLDLILNRLGNYLLEYEGQLSTVVAEERYEQREIRDSGGYTDRAFPARVQSRKLVSDVAFLRLPGGAAWFGVRDVRQVDGHAVSDRDVRLLQLIERIDPNRLEQDAARIVAASAVYNLGSPRTINMPTTPLEVLHPAHHVRFSFKLQGREKIGGADTVKVEFQEFDEPTLINGMDGEPLFIRGTAWIEFANGRLWRAQMTVRPPSSVHVPRSFQSLLRIDYAFQPDLGMMVPKEMYEEFFVLGGRGTGLARYSKYRRFTTGTRLLPPG
jgi:hypothetical protein